MVVTTRAHEIAEFCCVPESDVFDMHLVSQLSELQSRKKGRIDDG